MNYLSLFFVVLSFASGLAEAKCDLTHFRWDCDLPLHVRPNHHAASLVYCGNAYGYVNPRDDAILKAYQRADVNMVLTINDEYATSPCIPDQR